jgi:hypothetical protein
MPILLKTAYIWQMYGRYWRNEALRWAGGQGSVRLIVSDKSKANKSKEMKSLDEEPALQRACLARSSQAQAHIPRGT